MLPAGISAQTIQAGGSQVPSGLLLLHGTPTEIVTRRLQVKVVDAAQNSHVEDFWLIAGDSGKGLPTPVPDRAPRIVAGGHDVQATNGYLLANTPTDVRFRAWVEDSDNDAACVKLFGMADNHLGAILPAETADDASGTQPIEVHIAYVPAGTTVCAVTAIVRHNVSGVTLAPVSLTQSATDPLVWEGTFAAPASWMGWGHYSANAQVVVKDGLGNVTVSDQWPRLRAH